MRRVIAASVASVGLVVALAVWLAACQPKPANSLPTDMSLGSPSAKVTVTEYASLGCPICAMWNNDNFAAFKAKYIDTNQVHYVLKEMTNGDGPVATAGFLLARCAGKDKYFQVVDSVWREEAPYLESDKAAEKANALRKIAESAGLSDQQFDTCVTNDAARDQLNKKVEQTVATDHVEATPTFMVNGKVCDDCQDPKNLDKAILAAEGASK
jgi:protein-disulfide isomerase